MAEVEVRAEVICVLRTSDAGEQAINRYVGLTPQQGRALATTPGLSREDIEFILARSAILTGYTDASRFDGFADLHPGDIDIYIDTVQEA